MKTLIIYDNAGFIYITQCGNYELPKGGIQYMEVAVPNGKYPIRIDMETNTVIYGENEKTDTEKLMDELEQLKNDMADLMIEIALGGL